jgi:tetratricopeptide (TPR) repeat protein
MDWGKISYDLRQEFRVGRDRFALLLGVSAKTVLRWERHGVAPHPPQQTKLLLLREQILGNLTGKSEEMEWLKSLIDRFPSLVEVVVERLWEKIQPMREAREKKNTHRAYSYSKPSEALPSWWYKLRERFEKEDWQVLIDFGAEFDFKTCPPPERAQAQNWLGVAWFRMGHYEKARKILEEARDGGAYGPNRSSILTNLALVYTRVHEFHLAESSIGEAVEIDPRWLPGLFNGVSIGSLKKDERLSARWAEEIIKYYPEAKDPLSKLAREILADPDLEWFRATKTFQLLLPELIKDSSIESQRTTKRGGSMKTLLLIVATGLLTHALLVNTVFALGMTSGVT